MAKEQITEENVEKKILKYRGQDLEDLKAMDVREVSKFLPSTSRRYVLRNFNVIEKFIKRCEKKLSRNKKIKTHLREIVIVPKMVGLTIGVYTGKAFLEVPISHEMIGHRLGEFAPSRGRVNHGKAGLGATKSSSSKKK